MIITMNMSSYEIERDAKTFEEYDDEIMNTGWNPAVDLVSRLQETESPADNTQPQIAEIILRKLYSFLDEPTE